MKFNTRDINIEALFAQSGFTGEVVAHLSPRPLKNYAWQHLTPALASDATQKRRSEFADGRELAQRCLATLGLGAHVVGRGAGREPLWPPGVVGSITHTAGLAAAIAGRSSGAGTQGIGVDAERIHRLDDGDREQIFTHAEQILITASPESAQALLETCLFSAKEAVFKAQFALTRRFLDFDQVELAPELAPDLDPTLHTTLDPTSAGPVAGAGRLRVVRDLPGLLDARISTFYSVHHDHIVTGCVIAMDC